MHHHPRILNYFMAIGISNVMNLSPSQTDGEPLRVKTPKTIQDIVRSFEVDGLGERTNLNRSSGCTSKSNWLIGN